MTKYVAWFPQGLNISLPPCFLTPNTSFCILEAPMDSMPFVKSFVIEAFQEDFSTIINLLMFTNPQTTFTMLLFCYAQCLGYFLCIVLLSLSILKHYMLSLH